MKHGESVTFQMTATAMNTASPENRVNEFQITPGTIRFAERVPGAVGPDFEPTGVYIGPSVELGPIDVFTDSDIDGALGGKLAVALIKRIGELMFQLAELERELAIAESKQK